MRRKVIKKVQAVIYNIKDNKVYFLILHRILRWKGWELLKGTIEDEDLKNAMRREIFEEVGLRKIKIIKGLNKRIEFNWGKTKKVIIADVFLVRANMDERISLEQDLKEHDKYEWVDKETAIKKLTYDNAKRILKNLHRKVFK